MSDAISVRRAMKARENGDATCILVHLYGRQTNSISMACVLKAYWERREKL
jgi:hypothetical protein